MSLIGSHSIFSVYDLMDACNLFDYFGPLLYTSFILGWLIIKYLNKISFTH